MLYLLFLLNTALANYLAQNLILSISRLKYYLIILFLRQGLLVPFFLFVSGSSSILRTIFKVVVVGVFLVSTGFLLVPPVDLLRLDVIGVRGEKTMVLFAATQKW